MNQLEEAKEKFKQNVDWKIVISSVVATVIIGAGIYGLKKYGGKVGKTAATVVKGGA